MQHDINNLPKKIPKEQFWGIIQDEVEQENINHQINGKKFCSFIVFSLVMLLHVLIWISFSKRKKKKVTITPMNQSRSNQIQNKSLL